MAASLGIASEKIYKLIMKKTSVLKLVMIEYSFKNQILKSFDMPIWNVTAFYELWEIFDLLDYTVIRSPNLVIFDQR